MEFCCEQMRQAIELHHSITAENHQYTMMANSPLAEDILLPVNYCLWCGKKL